MLRRALNTGNFRESLVMALAAIRSSKLRSVLTILGIVVGIFSIISVMTALGVLQRNASRKGSPSSGRIPSRSRSSRRGSAG